MLSSKPASIVPAFPSVYLGHTTLIVLNCCWFWINTAVEYHILQDRHFSRLSSSAGTPTTYNVLATVGLQLSYPLFFVLGGSPLWSSVQPYNRTGTSWPSYLEQVPDLYSDALTNVIGTSIYARVCAWIHMARDYGVLYNNSRPFVVPIPLLSVDPLAIAIALVSYPCLPAFSQFLPTNRLYAAQICENIGTPPSPFLFSCSALSYEQVLRCQTFARFLRLAPIFFFQLCDSNRVLLVKCVTPLVLFLPIFAALPTKPGCMLQNPFKSCGLLLLDKIIEVFPTDLVDNARSLYVSLCQTNKKYLVIIIKLLVSATHPSFWWSRIDATQIRHTIFEVFLQSGI